MPNRLPGGAPVLDVLPLIDRTRPLIDNAAETAADLVRGSARLLPQDGLSSLLTRTLNRPLRVKFGIDPSGSELTLGHAVVLRKLRQFQDRGHTAVLVIGDFTATIGDPTGRSAARRPLTLDETTGNAQTYLEQASQVLTQERLEVRWNSQWLADLGLHQVLAQAQHLTVAQMLERDDFASRYAQHHPIALSEFFYPLLQGIDSVAIHADVELGGSDQLFNLTVGRDLQRAAGQTPQVVLTMPLLVGLDGIRKMSKSLNNYVALTEPAAEQFGKLMSVPDAAAHHYALLCTDASDAELRTADADIAAGGARAASAKRRLARTIVSLYHGPAAAHRAETDFDHRVRDRGVPHNAPPFTLPPTDSVHLPALLVEARLCSTRSQARRLLDQGAVRLDGEQLPAGLYDQPRSQLAGRVIQVGRRTAARLTA